MQTRIRYVVSVLKHCNGGFPVTTYVSELNGHSVTYKLTDTVEKALIFNTLNAAYTISKRTEQRVHRDWTVHIRKLEYTIKLSDVPKEEIRTALLDSAKGKLTEEEYKAIQHDTLPNKYHKEYKS